MPRMYHGRRRPHGTRQGAQQGTQPRGVVSAPADEAHARDSEPVRVQDPDTEADARAGTNSRKAASMTWRTAREKNEKRKMAVPRVAARAPERACRAGAARGDDQGRAAPTPSPRPG